MNYPLLFQPKNKSQFLKEFFPPDAHLQPGPIKTVEYRGGSFLFRFRDRSKEPGGLLPPAFYKTPTKFLDAAVIIAQGQ